MSFLNIFWFAQLIGLVALIYQLASFYGTTRKRLLVRQIIASIFFVLHFLLLEAYIGAAANLIIIFRNFVFEEKDEKRKWASNSLWLLFFILILISISFYSWKGLISLLPILSTIMGTYARWSGHPDKIRAFSLLSTALWIPYNLFVGSIIGVITQVIIAGFIIYSIFKLDKLELHTKL